MAVDLEAIARRGRCDVSSLRNALPLLQQGYSPPFLARYRRDELGGVDEASLWSLAAATSNEDAIAQLRDQLHSQWQATALVDPAIGHAIRKSNTKRMLERLGRRLKSETADAATPSNHLAVRLLNPKKGDGDDLGAIAQTIESISDQAAATDGIDDAIAARLAGDPRVVSAAVRWLSKHAKIHIASVTDPHTPAGEKEQTNASKKASAQQEAADGSGATTGEDVSKTDASTDAGSEPATAESTTEPAADSAIPAADTANSEVAKPADSEATSQQAESGDTSQASLDPAADASPTPAPSAAAPAPSSAAQAPATENAGSDSDAPSQVTEQQETEQQAATPAETSPEATPDVATEAAGDAEVNTAGADPAEATGDSSPAADKDANPAASAKGKSDSSKKSKKISPRQRRRRWLVSVLKPLAGKRFAADKLSSFQIVMLGRALRSQVAVCSFEYDAGKLVAEIQRTVAGFNRPLDGKLKDIVMQHEASIREAAEGAWWDELHERASSRLVGIVADHLRSHINRGCVDAKVVMSIDAVGPRTAATAIISADGRVLHCEDLPCQLSKTLRSQAVAKMGELIHAHHVDLIVISNGPARRACMIALGDLIKQSPDKSVRWTLADRTGADAYAGSEVASQEMRTTPRRFRASSWLAFSVLQPAQAFAKVDPLKLRLSSFQRELSDSALAEELGNVVVSGASRGGVDVNSASAEWLARLPGMTNTIAQAIDAKRRESLLTSRDELLELEAWQNVVESRQALPFLRIFGSDDSLDGTLIHPDDYALAKKLAKSLSIELPPSAPPGLPTAEF